MSAAPIFRYEGYDVDSVRGTLTCRYSLGARLFEERITFLADESSWQQPAINEAARLVFLLTGFAYYDPGATSVVDLGDTQITAPEGQLLRQLYEYSLLKYTRRNLLAIPQIRLISQDRPSGRTSLSAQSRAFIGSGRPLVPFGAGADSIVAAELLRERAEPVIFIAGKANERLAAIERSAQASGLPILRAEREIRLEARSDRVLLPLAGDAATGAALPALALMAAMLGNCDSVAMPYGWRTSVGTSKDGIWSIGEQYSRSAGFEMAFSRVVAETFGAPVRCFSALRPFSDLWIARKFAKLNEYHATFLACDRALELDKSLRLDHWCAQCSGCCLTNLILAPFMARSALQQIFGGKEPLAECGPQSHLARRFEKILGLSSEPDAEADPTDIGARRAALALTSKRDDRAGDKSVHALAAKLPRLSDDLAVATVLLQPIGGHFIPDEYSFQDLA
jgi:UDP-N-acetyl-alpha-D-muramoyl-L-alanyl-L-glutamate epimerase